MVKKIVIQFLGNFFQIAKKSIFASAVSADMVLSSPTAVSSVVKQLTQQLMLKTCARGKQFFK